MKNNVELYYKLDKVWQVTSLLRLKFLVNNTNRMFTHVLNQKFLFLLKTLYLVGKLIDYGIFLWIYGCEIKKGTIYFKHNWIFSDIFTLIIFYYIVCDKCGISAWIVGIEIIECKYYHLFAWFNHFIFISR